jgi:hypothetical protein
VVAASVAAVGADVTEPTDVDVVVVVAAAVLVAVAAGVVGALVVVVGDVD